MTFGTKPPCFLFDFGATLDAEIAFFVGCHSAAISESIVAKSLNPGRIRCPGLDAVAQDVKTHGGQHLFRHGGHAVRVHDGGAAQALFVAAGRIGQHGKAVAPGAGATDGGNEDGGQALVTGLVGKDICNCGTDKNSGSMSRCFAIFSGYTPGPRQSQ